MKKKILLIEISAAYKNKTVPLLISNRTNETETDGNQNDGDVGGDAGASGRNASFCSRRTIRNHISVKYFVN